MSEEVSEGPGWGKGWIPSTIITVCILILLSFNLIALGLSFPEVIDGAPKEYGSSLTGSLPLPYLPTSVDDLDVDMDENVTEGLPFRFVVLFEPGKVPYGTPSLELVKSPHRYVHRLGGGYAEDGRYLLSVLAPGVPSFGTWSMGLNFSTGKGSGLEFWTISLGTLDVKEGTSGRPILLPELDEHQSFNGSASFTLIGERGIVDPWFAIDGGALEPMVSTGAGYRVSTGSLSVGWHVGRVIWDRENLTDGYDLLFRNPGLETSSRDLDIAFQRIVHGEDELYGQNGDHRVDHHGRSISLFGSVHYLVNVTSGDEIDRNRSNIPSDLRPFTNPPDVTIGYEDVLIQLQVRQDGGGYGGVLPIKTNQVELTIALRCSDEPSISSPLEISVSLLEDHAPSLILDPDPYLDPLGDPDHMITLSSGRVFSKDPTVQLDSIDQNLSSSDRSGRKEWKAVLSGNETRDGGTLTIDVTTEYSFFTYLLLIFPFPPFLAGIPPLIVGWPLVAWFFLTSAIVVWASLTLVLKGLGSLKKRSTSIRGLEAGLSEWGPVETARVFSAAIFFSIAVVILFQMLDQPTPSPALLSTSVPVWIRMISLAEASVWEEFSGRFLLMGLPLALIHGIWDRRREKDQPILKNIFDTRQLLGGTGRFGRSEVILILLSAFSFGMAHLGWGPWKVAPTVVSGLLFGYLFVKVGIHATIIMHFVIDYLGFLDELTGFGGVTSTLILMFLALIGCLFLGDYLYRGIGVLVKMMGGGKVPSYVYMISHFSAAVTLAGLLYSYNGMYPALLIMATVLLMSLAGYFLHKGGARDMGKVIIYISSLITTAFGPLGSAWIYSIEDGQDRSGK